jgi:hypothetical protein
MSQFLIAISKSKPKTKVSGVRFVKASKAQALFSEVAEYYGIEPSCAWAVLDESGDTTDSIFACAGQALSEGDALSSTDLGVLLGELLYSGAGLIAWYGSDFQDLEKTNSVIGFVEYLNRDLSIGSGDVYFEYR